MKKKTGGLLTIQGIDTSKPAEYISERTTPDCQNVEIDRFTIKKRPGTTTVGATMSQEIMAGRELDISGTKKNTRIGLTALQVYTSGAWADKTGTALTGTTADPVCTCVSQISSVNWLIFTNGIDAVRKFDGSNNSAVLGGTPPVCDFLTDYKGYLVLAKISSYPMRVQWSDTGLIETWTGGNSGSADLLDDAGEITGIGKIGDYLTIHKENCIYLGYLVPTTDIFRFDRKSTGSGTICNGTIQELPTGEQIYLANDGLRLFNGISSSLIESPVTDELRETLNPEYVHKSWSIQMEELDEVWIAVPIGSQTTPDTIYKYNYNTKTIHKDVRSGITAAWKYTQSASITWDSFATGVSWDSVEGRWNNRDLENLFSLTMFGDNTGLSYKRDTTVNNDNSVAVNAYWTSKDFENEEKGRLCRWNKMEFWAKGQNIKIDYSTDEGITWNNISTYALSSYYPIDSAPLIAYFDVVSSKIRFKFSNATAGETFNLKQFIVSYLDREVRA